MTLGFSDPNKPLIGINGRFLIAQRTGVQRSAYRLLRSVLEQGERYNFVLFTGESEAFAEEWRLPHLRLVTSPFLSRQVVKNHIWEQFILPRMARKYKVDFLHNPANLAPILFARKSIVNIHDLCFLVEPSWFAFSFRVIYSMLVPLIAERAAVVITDSNYSKNDILEYLSVPLNRIRMAYWAVDPLFFRYETEYSRREDRILYVGSIEPRKNLAGLLKAFNIFKTRNPTAKTKLTLVGCENSVFASQKFILGPFQNDIEFVGYMSDLALAKLYGNSRMLVYPSFYEGFGFPPLEAMAAGTPVITSRNSSLPEVVGNAAVLIDPSDPEEMASRIESVYFDGNLARDFIQKGKQQVRLFSWERVGSHTLRIYDELLAGRNLSR